MRTGTAGPASIQTLGLLVICLATFAWLLRGYSFPTPNHGQNVLMVQAVLDPTLYTSDFAVQSFIGPTPRYVYQVGVAEVSRLFRIDVDTALFVFNILAHLSFYAGALALVTGVLRRFKTADTPITREELLLCLAFCLSCTLPLMTWGIGIFNSGASPGGFSAAIAIWAPALAVRGAWRAAFACAGLAVTLQFIIGLFAGLVLLPALALHTWRSRHLVRAATAIALWLTPAVVIYGLMLTHRPDVPPGFDFLEVFGHFRAPHHWLPSTGSKARWLSDLLLVLSATLTFRFLWHSMPVARDTTVLLAGMIGAAIIGVGINYVFVELLPVTLVGKLQFQRIMPFGHLAAYLLLASALSLCLRQRRMVRSVLCATLLAAPSLLARQLTFPATQVALLAGLVAVLILFVVLRSTPARIAITCGFIAVFGVVNAPWVSSLPAPLAQKIQSRYSPFENPLHPGHEITGWLRENTPKDALVMIPPTWDYFSEFLSLYARRGVYFSFKNVPFTDDGVFEWSRRGEAMLNARMTRELTRFDLPRLWQQQSTQKIIEIARAEDICYLLDQTHHRPDFPTPALVSQNIGDTSWSLWEFEHCRANA